MRIAQVGNLANVAYNISKHLRKKDLDVELFIVAKKGRIDSGADPRLEDSLQKLAPWIHTLDTSKIKTFIFMKKYFSKYDFIEAYTLSPIYLQFVGIPYICHATGTDLREFVFEKKIVSKLLKRAYFKSQCVFFTNPDLIYSVKRLGLKSYAYIPLIVDIDKYIPHKPRSINTKSKITFFCPTRWDWKIKGIDKVIRAFSKLAQTYKNVEIILVDYLSEPDRNKTLDLIKKQNLEKQITILGRMNKKELIKEYQKADVIIDQFILGSVGLVTLEAMALGKPVIVYLNEEPLKILKESVPPILNARSIEEIYMKMNWCYNNPVKINVLGQKSKSWIKKNHSPDVVIQRLIKKYYELNLIKSIPKYKNTK